MENDSHKYVIDYFPYGKMLREFVPDVPERYLTTQHERDRKTGLDYRGARYYDSDVARFLSLDPLSAKFPSVSAYNYVFSNPVYYVDPRGMEPDESDKSLSNNKKKTGWTDNHLYLNQVFGDSYGFNSLIQNQVTARIVSGGVNVYRGGLAPGTNGIDVTIEVQGLKGATQINILQTIKITNDDNINKKDAHDDNIWYSGNGKELGFVDGSGIFYYTAAEYNNFIDFNSSTGTGTIHLVDGGSQFNNPNQAYRKTVVHSYIVALYPDNSLKVVGRIEWVFYKRDNKIVQWEQNSLKIIFGNFTRTDERIIEISTGKKVN